MKIKRTRIATGIAVCLASMGSVQAADSLTNTVLKNHPQLVYPTNKNQPKPATPNMAGSKIHFAKDYPEGRVMVRLKAGVNPNTFKTQFANSLSAGTDIQLRKSFPLQEPGNKISAAGSRHLMVLESKSLTTKEFIDLLKRDPAVDVAEPDYFVYAQATTPNDSRFTELWGMNNTGQTGGTADADIDAPEAWDRITGNGSVIVGDIDTGVDYLHPDLVANIWRNQKEANGTAGVDDDANGYIDDIYGIDALNNTSDPYPYDAEAHGTHVAGTLGGVANNSTGVAGVAWNTKIAACKFLGPAGGNTADAIECVNYFTALKNRGENIVATNNSWGGGAFSQLLKDAIDASGAAGTLFIAAAGNSARDNDAVPSYPASYDSANIIAVAATDANDTLATFSQWGATSVDLAAPGVGILSSTPSTAPCSGTSYFQEGVESGLGGWTLSGTATWSQDNTEFHAGSFSALDHTGAGNYLDNTMARMEKSINLSAATGSLCGQLWVKGQTETRYDTLDVYISNDNGTTWTLANSTSSLYSTWTNLTFPIPDAYKSASFRIALVRSNDSSINYPGYKIDDLGINSLGLRIANYEAWDGTSMATPHVTGAVALAAMAFPSESVAARKARILNNVDPVASLTGVVLTGGRLNVAKVVAGGTDNLLRWPDVNGDAKADLLLRNYSTGANLVRYMDGVSKIGQANIPALAATWRAGGTPDLNGDGKADILWRDQSTGANRVWYMNGVSKIGQANIGSFAVDWKIAGTPDLNGDGKPDILWRSYSTGANKVWYMNGISKTGQANISSFAVDWRIVGTPDLNGDGKPDILWRSYSTGANKVWYMNGVSKIGQANIASLATAWRIVGTPDSNRDGKPDILWRNQSTGANLVWYMNGISKTGQANVSGVTTDWRIVNNGDF